MEKNIDYYLITFLYGNEKYCIVRQSKRFRIVKLSEDSFGIELLIDTEHYHDYSNYLMGLLGIDINCLLTTGETVNITPPLLFRFQYIDQDKGWSKIGESFTNMKYIINWDDYTSKYVVGYQGEEFYRTKKEINILKKRIDELQMKLQHYLEFMEQFKKSTVQEEEEEHLKNNLEKMKNVLDSLNQLEKIRLNLKEQISKLKNERYEKLLAIKFLEKNIQGLNNDHSFAMEQEEVILCPFCGVKHKNSLEERVEIVKDIQAGNKLIKTNRDDIKEIDKSLLYAEEEYKNSNQKYIRFKKIMENTKEGASIVKTYQNEGKKEIINSNTNESEKIKVLIKQEEELKLTKEEHLEGLKSVEKRNQIYKDLKRKYSTVMNHLNIPLSYMKFKNFVQVLDKTGSDLPRLIYAYHIALYLYNLEKGESVFNWLVVDTPNQQGQDEKNLKNIDFILEFLMSKKGQFIIGTERETGFEEKANRVIRLSGYKECLSNESYFTHKKLVNDLTKTIIND
ncbi:hypothetical protein [Priestia sp. YIM B13486]|uniref:hypothetical protein n=1 Tax=Priestia sp. YIM B13486 TaxID=3366304 RepID=UPI0036717E2E